MPTKLAAASLLKMLDATIPHASTDHTLPSVCTVRFETGNGRLTTVATDRYSMGVASLPAEINGRLEVNVPVMRAKELATMLRRRKKATAILQQKDHGLNVDLGDITFLARPHGWRKGFDPAKDGVKFPEWRSILPRAMQNETEIGRIALSPALLARIRDARASMPSSPAVFRFCGQHKPVVISFEDWFVVSIMPIRERVEHNDPFALAAQFSTIPEATEPTASDVEKESA